MISVRTRLIGAVIVFVTLNAVVTAWALYARFSETNSRRATQIALNHRFAAVTQVDCLEIEKLKTNVRQTAIDNFNKLDATLALLHIKKTPAIVARAREDRDHALKAYAAEACPRPVPTGGKK